MTRLKSIFPLNFLPQYDHMRSWIEAFLRDLELKFQEWDKENPSKNDRPFLKMAWKNEDPVSLKKAKWIPTNQGDWMSLEYYKNDNNFKLTVSILPEGLDIQLWSDEGCIIGVLVQGINWNQKAKSFSLERLFVSVKKTEGDKELSKIKGRIKLLPQFDLALETWLRNIYNNVIDLDLNKAEEEFILSSFSTWSRDSFIWDSSKFLIFRDETQSPIFIKKGNISKSPIQLVEEEISRLKKEKEKPKKSYTYSVIGFDKVRRVNYPF